MRTRFLPFGACLVACAATPTQQISAQAISQAPSREYAGIYISTPDEEYFTPCGIEGGGDDWSLRFRDNERQAPFLKKVTAFRGFPPLTHFIRLRGRPGPSGRYIGFQTREIEVDSVLYINESLEPCAGFGVPAAWTRLSARVNNLRGVALSTDRRLAALMDVNGRISLWSSETGKLVRNLGSVAKGHIEAASYGPMTFSDDGSLLAVGGVDGIVRVWRLQDGKKIFSLALKDSAAVAKERAKNPPHSNEPGIQPLAPNSYKATKQVVFNKRRTLLATTNNFSSIIWSLKTGRKLAEIPVGHDFRRQVFFVGDEGLLITADSGRMTFRSYLDATPVTRPGARAGEIDNVTMSPDGRTIAYGSWGDSVTLWSIAESRGRALRVPGFATGAIAFSPDGNSVAIPGSSGLYLYDARTGAPIRAFHNFTNGISGAWFTGDGKAIVTVSTFDDRFRIVYVDPTARPASQPVFDDSLTAKLPLGPPPSTSPRTISGIVSSAGTNPRAVGGAEVEISDGAAPDSIIARATTSPGGYFSFNGIRFRHVVFHVRKPGFAPGVKYIHVNRWEQEGPWGVELTPAKTGSGKGEAGSGVDTRPAVSAGGT